MQNLIRKGDASSLKQQLVKSIAGIECKDVINNTPLLLAAYLGKSNCVEILLDIGQANYQVINVFGMHNGLQYPQLLIKISSHFHYRAERINFSIVFRMH